ncbi:MAG: transcription antitermination factor NusB [Caldisericaceae bacterium]
MKVKTKGREIAFKLLFAIDVGKNKLPDALMHFQYEHPVVIEYAVSLVNGTIEKMSQIDATISSFLEDWSIERISLVDKELLRIAIFEIENESEMSPGLVTFETVELAKRYGDIASQDFINGVLRNYLRSKDAKSTA